MLPGHEHLTGQYLVSHKQKACTLLPRQHEVDVEAGWERTDVLC